MDEKTCDFLEDLSIGHGGTEVQDKGPLKSIAVETSFKVCSSYQQAEEILRPLAMELCDRLWEDHQEHHRCERGEEEEREREKDILMWWGCECCDIILVVHGNDL